MAEKLEPLNFGRNMVYPREHECAPCTSLNSNKNKSVRYVVSRTNILKAAKGVNQREGSDMEKGSSSGEHV